MKYLSTTATVCRDKSKATGEKTLSIILPTELHGVSSKAGLEPATHGVTGEVSLIYGTCLYDSEATSREGSELHQRTGSRSRTSDLRNETRRSNHYEVFLPYGTHYIKLVGRYRRKESFLGNPQR